MAIKYAAASLKKHTSTNVRRVVMLNWVSDVSTHLNRIKFCFTPRFREYMSNIPDEEVEAWPRHNQILSQAWDLNKIKSTWIAKGNDIPKFEKGKRPTAIRFANTGATLTYDGDKDLYSLDAWVEDMNFKIDLYPSDIEMYPYKGDRYYDGSFKQHAARGNWK